jgi:AcrR family transcriptional regulator
MFDADVVLDKAVEAFRAKGFEATSVEDLERATGLRRASLYGAFRDKHSLYLAALRRYDATRATRMLAELESQPTGRKALERLLSGIVGQCASDSSGCLIANAAMERGNSDPGAARCIGDNRRRVEGALHAVILRGRADGSLKGRGDVAAKARLLFSVIIGLRVLAKSGASRAQLQEVADLALETV